VLSLAAAPQPSWAGIITAIGTVIIAATGLIGAIGVAVPLLRASKRNTEALAVQESKLNVIHTLVNSTLTAALQGQLDATRRELAMTLELFGQHQDPPRNLSDDQKAVVGALHRRVDELAEAMEDRAQQTRSADIQIEAEATRKAHA
jgi:hypothetical protein